MLAKFLHIEPGTKFTNPEFPKDPTVYIKLEKILPGGREMTLIRMIGGEVTDFVNCVEERTGRPTRVSEEKEYEMEF